MHAVAVWQDVAQGSDTVPDSTTTESESVSDVQLLRAGGDERTIFKLTLQVRDRCIHVATGYRSGPAPTSTGISTGISAGSGAGITTLHAGMCWTVWYRAAVRVWVSMQLITLQFAAVRATNRRLASVLAQLVACIDTQTCEQLQVSLHCLSSPDALHLQVTKVELLLNYEGSVDYPLAIGSIDNFLLELAVHPATLQVWHT